MERIKRPNPVNAWMTLIDEAIDAHGIDESDAIAVLGFWTETCPDELLAVLVDKNRERFLNDLDFRAAVEIVDRILARPRPDGPA